MSTKVSGFSYTTRNTPTITAGAYTAADALGDEMVIDLGIGGAVPSHSAFVIQSISIVDYAKQSAETDILFFDDAVTPAADNAAADFTDAQLAANFLGKVNIASGDYAALNDNSVATITNVGLQLKPATGGTDRKIYAYAVTRGTPTYASTSDLVFKFDFAADL
jgi:hypothetical protein